MRKGIGRRTAVGVAAGALAFLGLGAYLNLANGASPIAHPGPLTLLAFVGGTIGGLVAPLFGRRG